MKIFLSDDVSLLRLIKHKILHLFRQPPKWWIFLLQTLLLVKDVYKPNSYIVRDVKWSASLVPLSDFYQNHDVDNIVYFRFFHEESKFSPFFYSQLYKAIDQFPQAQFFYWDSIGADSSLQLHPCFNPEQFLARDYIQGHFVLRSDLLFSLSSHVFCGKDALFGGILMALLNLKDDEIVHIPLILHKQHLVIDLQQQSKVLNEIKQSDLFISKLGNLKRVVLRPNGRQLYWAHQTKYSVTIVIPTKNQGSLLHSCLESVFTNTDYASFDVLLIDNQSDEDASLKILTEWAVHPRVTLIQHKKPFNFSEINNLAIAKAKGEVICLMNNDIEVIEKNWLNEMISQLVRPNIAVVGAKLLYQDYTIQHAGVVVGLWDGAGHAYRLSQTNANLNAPRLDFASRVTAVTAACMVVRKKDFIAVGGFDEDLAVAFNDVDFCLRIVSGNRGIIWTPLAYLIHYESKSRGTLESDVNRKREKKEVDHLRELWNIENNVDAFYHPWLTHKNDSGTLAWFPRALVARAGSQRFMRTSR